MKYNIPKYLFPSLYEEANGKFFIKFVKDDLSYKLSLEKNVFDTLVEFVVPSTLKEVGDKFGYSEDIINEIAKGFIENGILVPHVEVPKDIERYSRHLLYYSMNGLDPVSCQRTLRTKKVALIGMGGIGNWLSLNLIGLGIKQIRLVDPDVVEKSNLTRQVLFNEEDCGQKKVFAAQNALKKKNEDTEIEAIDGTVTEETLSKYLEGVDFAVLSADHPPFLIQKWMNQACIEQGVPFFNVGYSGGIGIFGPLVIPGETNCLFCERAPVKVERKTGSQNLLLSNYQAPSFTCLNSTISSLASYEIVKYFLGIGNLETLYHQLQFNPLNFNINKKRYNKSEDCPFCHFSKVKSKLMQEI